MRTTRRLVRVTLVAGATVGLCAPAAWASGHRAHVHDGHFHGTGAYTPGVFGTVTAIGTDTSAGACGTSGASGSFTVSAYHSSTSWTVDVSAPPATNFVDPGVSDASFANVCVGVDAGALGPVDAGTSTVTASTVFVAPSTPPSAPRGVAGTVTAIGSDTSAGACGTSGGSGTFTLTTWQNTSWTVTVSTSDPTTTFVEAGVSGATFADVCVGSSVGARGSATGTDALTASRVFIAAPRNSVFGQVTAVGTDTSSGACGTAGASGSFTVSAYHSATSWTVDVSAPPATTFVVPGVTSPSFANVCVGEWAGAVGTLDAGTDTVDPTTEVFVAPVVSPPVPRGVFGTVTAIGSDTASGACGTAGAAGTFTVTAWRQSTPWTVTVSTSDPTTTFVEPGVPGATFADVCVGSLVGVLGTANSSDYTVIADQVLVGSTATWTGGQGSGGFSGGGWGGGGSGFGRRVGG